MSFQRGEKFRILSLVEDNNPPTGITDHGLDSAPVHLNPSDQIWTFTATLGLQLSIGRFPYTGVYNDGGREVVTATLDRSKDVTWHIIPIESRFDAYIITTDIGQTKGWTVEGANAPDAPIVIQPIIVTRSDPPQYLNSQLFKLEPVLD